MPHVCSSFALVQAVGEVCSHMYHSMVPCTTYCRLHDNISSVPAHQNGMQGPVSTQPHLPLSQSIASQKSCNLQMQKCCMSCSNITQLGAPNSKLMSNTDHAKSIVNSGICCSWLSMGTDSNKYF